MGWSFRWSSLYAWCWQSWATSRASFMLSTLSSSSIGTATITTTLLPSRPLYSFIHFWILLKYISTSILQQCTEFSPDALAVESISSDLLWCICSVYLSFDLICSCSGGCVDGGVGFGFHIWACNLRVETEVSVWLFAGFSLNSYFYPLSFMQ